MTVCEMCGSLRGGAPVNTTESDGLAAATSLWRDVRLELRQSSYVYFQVRPSADIYNDVRLALTSLPYAIHNATRPCFASRCMTPLSR